MAACHDDVAALKRPPEIANAQAQHGTDNGGDGAAVQFTPGLVLKPQLGETWFGKALLCASRDSDSRLGGPSPQVSEREDESRERPLAVPGSSQSRRLREFRLSEHVHDFLAGRRGERGQLFSFPDNVALGSHFHDWEHRIISLKLVNKFQ